VLPFTRVRIVGPSMEPTLRNGDWCLVRLTSTPAVGDVALIAHPRRPDLLIVKRLARRDDDGWWVMGDDPASSEDSRHFGIVPAGSVVGRVVWRYHPLRRAG